MQTAFTFFNLRDEKSASAVSTTLGSPTHRLSEMYIRLKKIQQRAGRPTTHRVCGLAAESPNGR
jgi:hypothetical protein